MKTLFLGTPALAVPYLELLRQKTDLVGVVTAPDEPSGRGYALTSPPVKEAALKCGLPVYQPETLRDPSPGLRPPSPLGRGEGEGKQAFFDQVASLKIDLGIAVAYGKFLPADFLRLSRLGFLNVHFSLLPAYRGAAPMQRVLIVGEKQTGVTLFWIDEGMDSGPVFLQKTLSIDDQDDAHSLQEKLVPLGVNALGEALERISKGDLPRLPQAGPPSLAPIIKKEEGHIQWDWPAREIANLIRGLTPSPGAYTRVPSPPPCPARGGGEAKRISPPPHAGEVARRAGEGEQFHRLKILKAIPVVQFKSAGSASAGEIVGVENGAGFVVKCSQDFLLLTQVQPEGKRPMSAWAYWQGARLKIGEKLG